MQTRWMLAAVLAAMTAGRAYAADAPKADAAKTDAKAPAAKTAPAAKSKDLQVAIGDVKWSPLDPSHPEGPQVAWINGDMKKGGEFYLKLPAGFDSGWHTHPSMYEAVVVTGTIKNPVKGQTLEQAPALAAGSYWTQSAKEAHLTACLAGAECLIAGNVHGVFGMTATDETGKEKKADKPEKSEKPAEPAK